MVKQLSALGHAGGTELARLAAVAGRVTQAVQYGHVLDGRLQATDFIRRMLWTGNTTEEIF